MASKQVQQGGTGRSSSSRASETRGAQSELLNDSLYQLTKTNTACVKAACSLPFPLPMNFLHYTTRGAGSQWATATSRSGEKKYRAVTAVLPDYKALKELMRSLAELQDELLYHFPETQHLIDGKKCKSESEDEILSDEEDGVEEDTEKTKRERPPKRKLEVDEYPEFMAKRFAAFRTYQNNTLQKWHDNTKLSGKIGKGFGAFERSILTQIEQIMMDKEGLLRRTQTKRSFYRILGKPLDSRNVAEAVPNEAMLLREVIERKTSSLDPNDQVAMGRQWLAIQKLRSKIKKKVDTKASKGRKIRYHVHSKLVSFMAPIDHSTMNDDARTELYQSLFGKTKCLDEEKQT